MYCILLKHYVLLCFRASNPAANSTSQQQVEIKGGKIKPSKVELKSLNIQNEIFARQSRG